MANIDTAYSSPTAITCTIASLTDTSRRQSDSWSSETGNVLDMLVRITTVSSTGGTNFIYVYTYGALETTSPFVYSDGASGVDSAFTNALINSPLLGTITANAGTSVTGGPFSMASAWGGFLPPSLGIIVDNESNATLGASGHDLDYISVYVTSV